MDAKKIALLEQGPFPNHFDPWLEKGHYFHQFHGHMITNLFNALVGAAMEHGYILGREASIQILNNEPDLFVVNPSYNSLPSRNFTAALFELGLEESTSFQINDEVKLDRLVVSSAETGRVVTVLELISPSNKSDDERIMRYQSRRQGLLNNATDIVEIDLIRSYKHLINNAVAQEYPYHIAIHLYDGISHFWGMALEKPLKSFALPIEDKVIPVELNRIYRQSYSQLQIAWQMINQRHYSAENLPFPSTISDAEREKLLAALEDWKAKVQGV
jgi:hypothetical protein